MSKNLPTHNITLLKALLGKRLIKVKRQLFKDDMDLTDYEESADGPIELTTENGEIIHFCADTETFSVGVKAGEMPCYGESYVLSDISSNSFWKDRVEKEIVGIKLLKSIDASKDYPCEFGIELSFANGKTVLFEYKDEEDYPDMLRIVDSYIGQPCISQQL